MTVFVAHAPADREAAEGLEKFLERRGQFVELDDGQTALRPVQPSDILVLLLSSDFAAAPTRLRLEQRALDAWADGRLILVRLDQSPAPVGLRDMSAVEMGGGGSEHDWQPAGDAIRRALAAPQHRVSLEGDGVGKGGGGVTGVALTVLLMLPGLGALAVIAAIWLVNRVGPTPGGLLELRAGVDQFGQRYGLPGGLAEWAFAIAIGALLSAIGLSISALLRRGAPKARHSTRRDDSVFVSFAQANQAAVAPVIEAAERGGWKLRLDPKSGSAAAGLSRSIRDAARVVVMCSKAAFDSDHIKREVYLADRYGKKLVPVFIEQADPPEDFEYFFAGAQSLNLFETPEAERPQALLRVLGAAA